jgi:hypothetical protein
MRPRILISLLAIPAILTVAVMLIAEDPDSHPFLSVSLTGYSNSVSGEKFAILAVTNRDEFTLAFDTAWVSFSHTTFEARVGSTIDRSFLKPGASRFILTEVPPHPGHPAQWRVNWMITRLTLRERLRPRIGRFGYFRRWFAYTDSWVYGSDWFDE